MSNSEDLNVLEHNSQAWDQQVADGCRWSEPAETEAIKKARQGQPEIVLTPDKIVPQSWMQPLEGKKVLLLAGGGGQQTPVIAAAGADVTCLDASQSQLDLDQQVASREGLKVRTILGDMANMNQLQNEEFDLVINPCSVGFVPDVLPVWKEVYRILKPGGYFLAGFVKPELFIFDEQKDENEGILEVVNKIPYSDVESLPAEELQQRREKNQTVSFSHSWDTMVGGQLQAGFVMTNFYEDSWTGDATAADKFFKPCFATRCQKPE